MSNTAKKAPLNEDTKRKLIVLYVLTGGRYDAVLERTDFQRIAATAVRLSPGEFDETWLASARALRAAKEASCRT